MQEGIKNQVIEINNDRLREIIQELESSEATFLAKIDGVNIQTLEDYIFEVQTQFKFPSDCRDSIDSYLDWIRDLDWIEAEEYVLIITNYSSFMKDTPEIKKLIISYFRDTILPFWQEEIKHVMVDGQPKRFMVYLVD